MKKLDPICNYLSIWLYSNNDHIAPWYLENRTYSKIPRSPACWLSWQVSHNRDLAPYTRAVITLKNYQDNRRVLDRAVIDLNKFYELF